MTVLNALQSAAIRLIGQRPAVFFSSQQVFEMEMVDLLNDVAADICKSHDWRALTRLQTYAGDGQTEAFDLPDDYDRMPVLQDIHSATWRQWRWVPAQSLDQWLDYKTFATVTPGMWIMLDGQIHFYPEIPQGEIAQFYYISKNYARGTNGALKPAFDNDNDEFLLPERLLTLGIVWRWREQKRLDSTADQENFLKAFNEAAGREKGSRVVRIGGRTMPYDARPSYPGTLG